MGDKLSMDALKERVDDGGDTEVADNAPNGAAVNMRPESVIYFDEIVDFGFTGDLQATQNILGTGDQRPGNFVVTLKNPEVGGGDCYQSTDPTQSAEYKLVGDHNVEPDYDSNGDVNGIKYGIGGGTTFNGELVDDFEHDTIEVYLGGGMGIYVGMTLDAFGGGPSVANGLIEYGNEEHAKAVRAAPLLRDDMEGRGGAIMARLADDGGENPAFLGTVFANGEDYSEIVPITDTDHEGYSEAVEDRYVAEAQWSSGESDSDVSLADATDDLSLPTGSEETTYSELSEEWKVFVDSVADQGVDSFEDDIGDVAADFADENDIEMDLDPDDLASIVESIN
jgi:hypothetical protein